MNKVSKIIVVGASGYIGKQLYLNATSKSVAYGTSSTGSKNLLTLQLNRPNEFNYSIIAPSDVVLLTAAISAPDVCAAEYKRSFAVNVTGTIKFINQVTKHGGRVIFFSSDTVYGEKNVDIDEHANCHPAGEYAEMKYEVEKHFLNNPLVKFIRLSYVFSHEDKFTKYLTDCAEHGEVAEIFHPFYRAIIHRDDVVEGAIALAHRWDEFPQNIINFGGPNVLARTEFVKILQESVLPNLKYRVVEPDSDFFKNRPKVIRMISPILSELLGRCPHSLPEATQIEFVTK